MTEADAILAPADDNWQIRFTRSLPHPPEKVWRAITETEHLKAWFPDTVVGAFAPGAELRFEYAAGSFDGRVITMDPPKLLEILWGTDTLRFELRPDGAGTELVFTDTITEVGKAARDTAGWHGCLDRLESALSGSPSAANADWKVLNDLYAERFGPEAATIGPPEGM
jgi:uncharacterized protein YndB with AHSA1/START domain